jgi:hypothetical protein
MDIDIGNILYIVITIVVVIVSLMGKKKKPATGGAASPGKSAQPGFMENLERVLNMNEGPLMAVEEPFEEQAFEEEPLEQPPAAEVTKSYDGLRMKGSLIEQYYQIMNRNSDGEMDLTGEEGERVTGSMEIIDLDEVPGADYFEIVEEFDAGKAVVYSTIINRLDY